jgi:hypothetical protein
MVEVHVLLMNFGEEEKLECDLILPDDGVVFHGLSIHLPEEIVDRNQNALRRGEWFVQLPGATVTETYIPGYGKLRSSIKLGPHSQINTISPEQGEFVLHSLQGQDSLYDGRRRRQDHHTRSRRQDQLGAMTSTGTRTLLVVRVSTSDASPTYTASELAQYFFDTNSYSLVRQYQRCSMGALQFQPFDFFSQVIDVVVSGQVGFFTKELLWAAANAAASAQRNVVSLDALSDHVAFILPPGTQGNYWIAAGTTGAWR